MTCCLLSDEARLEVLDRPSFLSFWELAVLGHIFSSSAAQLLRTDGVTLGLPPDQVGMP